MTCQSGKFKADGPGSKFLTACESCPAGTYLSATSDSTSANDCTACPTGTFSGAGQFASCEACATGTFNNAAGQTSCTGVCTATACADGTFAATACSATADRECVSIPVIEGVCGSKTYSEGAAPVSLFPGASAAGAYLIHRALVTMTGHKTSTTSMDSVDTIAFTNNHPGIVGRDLGNGQFEAVAAGGVTANALSAALRDVIFSSSPTVPSAAPGHAISVAVQVCHTVAATGQEICSASGEGQCSLGLTVATCTDCQPCGGGHQREQCGSISPGRCVECAANKYKTGYMGLVTLGNGWNSTCSPCRPGFVQDYTGQESCIAPDCNAWDPNKHFTYWSPNIHYNAIGNGWEELQMYTGGEEIGGMPGDRKSVV